MNCHKTFQPMDAKAAWEGTKDFLESTIGATPNPMARYLGGGKFLPADSRPIAHKKSDRTNDVETMSPLTPTGPSRGKTRPNQMTPSPGPPSPAATVHAVATEANAANPAWVFVAEDPGALPVRYDTDEKIVAALQPMTTENHWPVAQCFFRMPDGQENEDLADDFFTKHSRFFVATEDVHSTATLHANEALQVVMARTCWYDQSCTWHDKIRKGIRHCSWLDRNLLPIDVSNDDRVNGKNASHFAKNYETCKVKWLAVVAVKMALGPNFKVTRHRKIFAMLKDKETRLPLLCCAIPIMHSCISYLSNETSLTFDAVCGGCPKSAINYARSKYRDFGYWEKGHVSGLLKIELGNEHYVGETDSNMCRGIQYGFMRVIALFDRELLQRKGGKSPPGPFAKLEDQAKLGKQMSEHANHCRQCEPLPSPSVP